MAKHRLAPSNTSIASWPRVWGVGGPISSEGRITSTEAAAVLSDVARRGRLAAAIRLRHDADEAWLQAAGRFQVEESGRYVLDLSGGFDDVWQNKFRGTARTAMRKAERSDLEVEVDRTGRLLDVFFELYEKTVPRWTSIRHEPLWLTRARANWINPTSRHHLALVASHFGKGCATWVARSKGRPVAAVVVLSSGAYVQYRWGAMDKEGANPVRANEWLHRLVIEEACRDGYRFYDMGGAWPGSALAAFKEKLGATLHFTHFLLATHPAVESGRQLSRALVQKMTGGDGSSH
jgi:Acetyltransferase (GNAT) domain